ncbi:MAG: amidohydrolase [Rhodocyclaceae bacterium]|nr:MAG: amidohydrolase [Rhodocyclaceae bacterium]
MTLRRFLAIGLLAAWAGAVLAQSADIVLVNGKVVTVDERFTVTQALAIKGERVLATGSSKEMRKLAGPATRVMDLKGRTVIPGLIDNHVHMMRAAEMWDREIRLDGVTTHKQALEMIARKVRESKPGEWVLVLGGWAEEQFTDEKRGFSKEELDRIAPNNPVVAQLIYFRIYTNTAGLKVLGIDANSADKPGNKVEKDAAGQPNGVLNGAGAVGATLAKLGEAEMGQMLANAKTLMHDLNKVGITAFQDMGGRGFNLRQIDPFRTLAQKHEMTLRAFYNLWLEPKSPADVDLVLDKIKEMKPFQGDDWFDNTGYGETVYFPLHDNLLAAKGNITPEGLVQWRRVAQAVADKGMHLNVHAQLRSNIEAFLTEIEAINKLRPIKGLRWTFSHVDQLEPQDIERMKRLGMYAEISSRPVVQGALMLKVHGDRTYNMPPLRMVQASGLPWGLGSDATAVTPYNPFATMGWAVTGRMVGGQEVLKDTITREQALIAYTRSNAPFLFQEANLGSLAPGKYADLLVLDSDYLKVPADQIKDIKPVVTMVGGKIVYQANLEGTR